MGVLLVLSSAAFAKDIPADTEGMDTQALPPQDVGGHKAYLNAQVLLGMAWFTKLNAYLTV